MTEETKYTAAEQAELEHKLQDMRLDLNQYHRKTIHMSNLSSAQKEAFDQAKNLLAASNIAAPADENLLQFFKVNSFDAEKTVQAYKDNLEWRAKNDIDHILERPAVGGDIIPKIVPFAMYGHDKEGLPIYIEKTGKTMTTEIVQYVNVDVFILHHTHCMERLTKMMEEASKRTGKPIHTCTTILDMNGLSLAHRNTLVFLQAALEFDLKHYPERPERVLVVNTPWIAPGLWEMVKMFLDESTKSKVEILGWNYKEELLKYIDADQLPVEYGGTNPMVIREYTREELLPFVQHDGPMTARYVAAGEVFSQEIELATGDKINWAFEIGAAYDIGFSVDIVSKANASSVKTIQEAGRMVTNKGSYQATEACTAVFKWDNTFSYFYGKDLSYNLDHQKA